jgi:hypothetical protein
VSTFCGYYLLTVVTGYLLVGWTVYGAGLIAYYLLIVTLSDG